MKKIVTALDERYESPTYGRFIDVEFDPSKVEAFRDEDCFSVWEQSWGERVSLPGDSGMLYIAPKSYGDGYTITGVSRVRSS